MAGVEVGGSGGRVRVLEFALPADKPIHLLCLGAHSDDIEIGCGGTLLKLLETSAQVSVTWVVLSAAGPRLEEASASADLFLEGAARKEVITQAFRDGHFPFQGSQIKDFFETLKRVDTPDLIFTHARDDRHQDHRVVSDLTWNTFRNHLILEYEIAKYDGDLGNPNAFVRLPETIAQRKLELLMRCFASQRHKQWFDADTFSSLMRLRGVEANAPSRFAEGFYARKFVL